jgi:hypothetical protein
MPNLKIQDAPANEKSAGCFLFPHSALKDEKEFKCGIIRYANDPWGASPENTRCTSQ